MSVRIPLVDLDAEYAEVGSAIEEAVLRVLRSGAYVGGPELVAFEHEIAELVGATEAVGVGSGTDALALALRALGVGPGDEVVTSAMTFFATVEAIVALGAVPVLADIEPDGFNLDPREVERVLTPRTRAIVPVHLFGRCADIAALRSLAGERDLLLIEDAAQAIGAARDGRRAGAWGDAGCFSFYPSKNLGAAGDGGMVTTSDPALAAHLRLLRSHGEQDGAHHLVGTTSRLDALQAAVLAAKLPLLKHWTDARRRNARIYREELADCDGVVLPAAPDAETIVWNQYTIRCREPERVRRALERAGVQWRHYYPRPVCDEPGLGLEPDPGSFPRARRACAESLSIPVRPSCPPDTIREIAQRIRSAVGG